MTGSHGTGLVRVRAAWRGSVTDAGAHQPRPRKVPRVVALGRLHDPGAEFRATAAAVHRVG